MSHRVQVFSATIVREWKAILMAATADVITEEVKHMILDVMDSSTLKEQLSSAKKLSKLLSPSSHLVHQLVKMHASCCQRHPLQRAIASILQGFPVSSHSGTVDCLSSSLCNMILFESLKVYSEVAVIEYIEIMLENFPLGEAAVCIQAPLVLEYALTLVKNSIEDSRFTDGLLMGTLKVTSTLLRKSAQTLSPLFSEDLGAMHGGSCPQAKLEQPTLAWPPLLDGESLQRKRDWLLTLLSDLASLSEKLVVKAATVPHDISMMSGMLCCVVMKPLARYSERELCAMVKAQVSKWLGEGSSLSSLSKLVVCHGLLAKFPPSILLGVHLGEEPLLTAMLPILRRFLSNLNTSERYMCTRTLALWTSVVRNASSSVENLPVFAVSLSPSGVTMGSLLELIWMLWEDPVDGIRHQCQAMFENMIAVSKQIHPSGDSNFFLCRLASSLFSMETPTRGRYNLLVSLSLHLPVSELLSACPSLPHEIMSSMGHQALACHAGDLWSKLTKLHWDSIHGEKDVWFKTWVEPLVCSMCNCSQLAREHMVQYCLPSLFHSTEDCMSYISRRIKELKSVSPRDSFIVQLACLKCAKKECKGASLESLHIETLKRSMHHAEDEVSLSALGLLCESLRSTEPPPPEALQLVLHFIQFNSNNQSPGFRYSAITSIKKLLNRIKDSSYLMHKQHLKHRREQPTALLSAFKDFLTLLMKQQFSVIHPWSSFQRRHFSLSLLHVLSTVFSDTHTDDIEICVIFHFATAVSKSQARSLLLCLRDSFETNQKIALELLLQLPKNVIGLEGLELIEECCDSYLDGVSSPKAVSCAAAAYLLRLMMNKSCQQFNRLLCTRAVSKVNSQELKKSCSSVDANNFSVITTVHILCDVLSIEMEQAKRDLVHASMTAPMYGAIQSILVALEESTKMVDIYSAVSSYRAVVDHIVTLCHQITQLVSPVVCNSSPEGFFPDAQVESVQSQIPHDHSLRLVSAGNSQSLLLCCWHVMKETALLLGFLVEEFPTSGNDVILTKSQLDVIAGIFIQQLTEARHRGAFEMAYTGFLKLCHCLWTSPCRELSLKPSTWVANLLTSLQSPSLDRLLSITRRSAGLPFYLQAILTAEPRHSGRPCLKTAMASLLSLAKTCCEHAEVEASDGEAPPACVHALNILRALYRDSRLGEHIVPFISDGVMIAIEGFSAKFWPVKNSCTLLFSALVSRIFGAKKVQDEHSVSNKASANEFFTRFPSLHEFLLSKVQNAATLTEKNAGRCLNPSLFPVLLLLSRLYPSPLSDVNSPVSLGPFVPLLLRCAGLSEWKIRILVSRAVVPMLSANATITLVDIAQQLSLQYQNQLHGLLLILRRAVCDHPHCLRVHVKGGKSLAHLLLQQLLEQHIIASEMNHCAVTVQVYLALVIDIMNFIKEESGFSLHEVILCRVTCNAESYLAETMGSGKTGFGANILPREELIITSAQYLMLRVQLGDLNFTMSDILVKCLSHCSARVQSFALEELCLRGGFSVDKSVVNTLSQSVLRMMRDTTDEAVLAKVYRLLLLVSEQKEASHQFETEGLAEVVSTALRHALCENILVDLKCTLIHFISTTLCQMGAEQASQFTGSYSRLLQESCQPTQPSELREAVAKEMEAIWTLQLLHSQSTDGDRQPACLGSLVLELLQDCDYDVRQQAAASLGCVLSKMTQCSSMPCGCTMDLAAPNALTALHWFLSSLPTLLPPLRVQETLKLILSVINLADEPPHNESVNPLFDEDTPNEYAEEVELLQIACQALSSLLATHPVQLAPQISSLTSSLQHHIQTAMAVTKSGTLPLPLWKRSALFLHFLKVMLVARTVLIACPQQDSLAAFFQRAVAQIPEIRHLPLFINDLLQGTV